MYNKREMSRNLQFSTDEYYHVYNRGVDKRFIFLDDDDRNRFVKLLYLCNSPKPFTFNNLFKFNPDRLLVEIPREKTFVSIGAWCLMSNHFHLLIKETTESGLSNFMLRLMTAYSMYFNTKYQRKGALFEGTFKAKYLDTDNYLKYQYTYIHLNPIGIIDKGWKEKVITDKKEAKKFLEEYKYSSYQDYGNKNRNESAILNKQDFPDYFESVTDFNEMIDFWLDFENEEETTNLNLHEA
jgi:putative transposase